MVRSIGNRRSDRRNHATRGGRREFRLAGRRRIRQRSPTRGRGSRASAVPTSRARRAESPASKRSSDVMVQAWSTRLRDARAMRRAKLGSDQGRADYSHDRSARQAVEFPMLGASGSEPRLARLAGKIAIFNKLKPACLKSLIATVDNEGHWSDLVGRRRGLVSPPNSPSRGFRKCP